MKIFPPKRVTRSTLRLVLVALVLTAVPLAADAPAAFWDKKSKQDTEETKRAIKPDGQPTMRFLRGRLDHDNRGNWTLNGTMVWFTEVKPIYSSYRSHRRIEPKDGLDVLLMGYGSGGYFIVREALDMRRSGMPWTASLEPGIEWLGLGSTVGTGDEPN